MQIKHEKSPLYQRLHDGIICWFLFKYDSSIIRCRRSEPILAQVNELDLLLLAKTTLFKLR